MTCPGRIRRGFKVGFAAESALSLTLYRRAMLASVSPDWMTCVVATAAGTRIETGLERMTGDAGRADPTGFAEGWMGIIGGFVGGAGRDAM